MTIKPSVHGAAGLEWFKSSHSSNEGPDCVEVAASSGTVHVRDSKNKEGARLGFDSQGWAVFIAHVSEAN